VQEGDGGSSPTSQREGMQGRRKRAALFPTPPRGEVMAVEFDDACSPSPLRGVRRRWWVEVGVFKVVLLADGLGTLDLALPVLLCITAAAAALGMETEPQFDHAVEQRGAKKNCGTRSERGVWVGVEAPPPRGGEERSGGLRRTRLY
jgi:hypothetical protein